MRTVLKNTVLVLIAIITASAAAPALTPTFTTSESDAGVTIESMPSILTGTFTLPSGISQAPGPVIPSGIITTGSGTFSVSTASSSTLTNSTSSGTGTTTGSPASTSTPNGADASMHTNILIAGLLMLSAAGIQLF